MTDHKPTPAPTLAMDSPRNLPTLFLTPKTLKAAEGGLERGMRAQAEQAVAREWQPGDVIAELYDVIDILGEGGFGIVYKVCHRGWGSFLAVKSLLADLAQSPEHTQGFIRECEGWVNLGLHPHIVSCYYVRDLGGLPRIFSEYMAGGSLEDVLAANQPPDFGQVLDWAIQMLDGLAYAHGRGIVHRDVKPGNCLLTGDGTLKITDFGIASGLSALKGITVSGGPKNGAEHTLFIEEGVAGTPAYMPPEQWGREHGEIGPWSDIYAAGILLFELCCGERPFDEGGEDALLIKARHVSVDPPGPDEINSEIPEELAGFILKCLQKKPAARFLSCGEAREALVGIYRNITGKAYSRPLPQEVALRADSLNNRAVSLMDLGLVDEALKHWDEALTTDTLHLQSTFNRDLVLWRQGLIDDTAVLEALAHVKKEHPDSWEIDYCLGLIHLERDDLQSALKALESARQASGDNPETAAALDAARRHLPASTRLERISSIDGKNIVCQLIEILPDNCRAILGGTIGVDMVDLKTGVTTNLSGTGANALAVNPTGTHLLTGSYQTGNLALRDLSTGKYVTGYRDNKGGGVYAAALSSDHRLAAYVTDRRPNVPVIWDIGSDRFVIDAKTIEHLKHTLNEGDLKRVSGLMNRSFTQNQLQNVLRGFLGGNRIPAVLSHSDKRIRHLEGHKTQVTTLFFSRDNRRLISASLDGTLNVWDVNSGACQVALTHGEAILAACISADGKHILSLGEKTIKVWANQETTPIKTIPVFHRDQATTIALSSDPEWIFTGGKDKTVKLYDFQSGQCLRTLEDVGRAFGISLDGAMMVDSTTHNEIRIWQIQKGGFNRQAGFALCRIRETRAISANQTQFKTLLAEAEGFIRHQHWPEALTSIQQARRLEGYERDPEALKLWQKLFCHTRKSGLAGAWCRSVLNDHASKVTAFSMNGHGNLAASGSENGAIILWDVGQAKQYKQIQGNWGKIKDLALSCDGTMLLSVHQDKTFRQHDLKSGKSQIIATHPRVEYERVTLSRDKRLALTGAGQTMGLWDLGNKTCLKEFVHQETLWYPLKVQMDALCGTAVTGKQSLKIWNLASGARLRDLKDSGSVQSLKMSDDGQFVLSGTDQGHLVLWNLKTGQMVQKISASNGGVTAVELSPDNRWAFSGGGTYAHKTDFSIKIWDLQKGVCIRTLEGHNKDVIGLGYSPDGACLVSASADQSVRIWDLDWELEALTSDTLDLPYESALTTLEKAPAIEAPAPKPISGATQGKIRKHLAQGDAPAALELLIREKRQHALDDAGRQLWQATLGKTRKIALQDAKRLRSDREHEKPITAVCVAQGGLTAATGDLAGVIKIWNLQDLSIMAILGQANGWQPVKSLLFIEHGTELLSGHADNSGFKGSILHWQVETGKILKKIEDILPPWHLSSNGAQTLLLASCAKPGTLDTAKVLVLDITAGTVLHTIETQLKVEGNGVSSFLPDDRHVAVADGPDLRIIALGKIGALYQRPDPACETVLKGHAQLITGLHRCANAPAGISASLDGSLRIWDFENRKCLKTILLQELPYVKCLAGTADGRFVFAAGNANWQAFDSASGQLLKRLPSPASEITQLAMDDAGFNLLLGCQDGTLETWDLAYQLEPCDKPVSIKADLQDAGIKKEQAGLLNLAVQKVKADAWQDCIKLLGQIGPTPKKIPIWKKLYTKGVKTGQVAGLFYQVVRVGDGTCTSLCISRKGELAVTGSRDGCIQLWKLPQGELQAEFGREEKWGPVYDAVLSEDNQTISALFQGLAFQQLDAAGGDCRKSFEIKGTTRAWAMSRNGKVIAFVLQMGSGKDIKIRYTDDPDQEILLQGHEHVVNHLAICDAGKTLVSSDLGYFVKCWDVAARVCTATFYERDHKPKKLAISGNGRYVFWSTWSHLIRFWNRSSSSDIRTLKPKFDAQDTITELHLSFDNRFLVCGGNEKIRIMDVKNADILFTSHAHFGPVSKIRLTPDGLLMVSVGADDTLRLRLLEWGLTFPAQTDFDKIAQAFVEDFIARRPIANKVTGDYLRDLFTELQFAGLGHISPDGVRDNLRNVIFDMRMKDPGSLTDLVKAAQKGDVKAVESWLQKGAGINTRDEDGIPLLHHAITSGNLRLLEFLIAKKPDIDAADKKSETALHKAVCSGNQEAVEQLLSAGADAQLYTLDGKTALHLAAEKGFADIARFLLNSGAKIDSKTSKRDEHELERALPLHYAAMADDPQIVEVLLDAGADPDCKAYGMQTPLHIAAKKAPESLVALLIAKGGSVDARDSLKRTPLHLAIKNDRIQVVKTLIARGAYLHAQDHFNNTPLHLAAEDNNEAAVELLIQEGALSDLGNQHNRTPLHLAVMKDHTNIVAMLLDHGADVTLWESRRKTALERAQKGSQTEKLLSAVKDAKQSSHFAYTDVVKLREARPPVKAGFFGKFGLGVKKPIAGVNQRDDFGETALFQAVKANDSETVKKLLAQGANPNLQNKDGQTPLMIALTKKSLAMVKDLLLHRAGVKFQDKENRTALHIAAHNGQLPLVEILIHKGANINAQTKTHTAPLHEAVYGNHLEVVKALLQHGADPTIKNTGYGTPLQIAKRQTPPTTPQELRDRLRIIEVLEQAGSRGK